MRGVWGVGCSVGAGHAALGYTAEMASSGVVVHGAYETAGREAARTTQTLQNWWPHAVVTRSSNGSWHSPAHTHTHGRSALSGSAIHQ
jgi:hypothetical protein